MYIYNTIYCMYCLCVCWQCLTRRDVHLYTIYCMYCLCVCWQCLIRRDVHLYNYLLYVLFVCLLAVSDKGETIHTINSLLNVHLSFSDTANKHTNNLYNK